MASAPCSPHKIMVLQERAAMLNRARSFFEKLDILEVDCPIISTSASVDAHIDLISVVDEGGGIRYLHSSPEFGMKRLLSSGIGDIYQLSHVFRLGEYGVKHNPEFMMAEWYRIGISFEAMMDETAAFARLFLGPLNQSVITYREAMKRYAGIDYLYASDEDLISCLRKSHIEPHLNETGDRRETLLNLIMGTLIEPHLGLNELTLLAYYPASQAALARRCMHDDEEVAERFELYFQGVELANGYHELADANEQRKRFVEANIERERLGKKSLPLDELFLEALENGLPDCCGVAVGFDRLMMLRQAVPSISDVIPFDWLNT